jgi:hypothetical protein
MNARFVVTTDGDYLLEVTSDVLFPRWGFALCDDEQSWEGGFGVAGSWTVVPASEVPEDIRRKLEYVREELEEIEADREAERED